MWSEMNHVLTLCQKMDLLKLRTLQKEEDFTFPYMGSSNNDQFEDCREEVNTSSFLPSSVKQPTEAKVLRVLWRQYLLLNLMLEMDLLMTWTLPI